MSDIARPNASLERAVVSWPDVVYLRINGQDVTFVELGQPFDPVAAGMADESFNRGDSLFVCETHTGKIEKSRIAERWRTEFTLDRETAAPVTEMAGV